MDFKIVFNVFNRKSLHNYYRDRSTHTHRIHPNRYLSSNNTTTIAQIIQIYKAVSLLALNLQSQYLFILHSASIDNVVCWKSSCPGHVSLPHDQFSHDSICHRIERVMSGVCSCPHFKLNPESMSSFATFMIRAPLTKIPIILKWHWNPIDGFMTIYLSVICRGSPSGSLVKIDWNWCQRPVSHLQDSLLWRFIQ